MPMMLNYVLHLKQVIEEDSAMDLLDYFFLLEIFVVSMIISIVEVFRLFVLKSMKTKNNGRFSPKIFIDKTQWYFTTEGLTVTRRSFC